MNKPSIAVLLPVYKKDVVEYVHLSVDSILHQSYGGAISLFIGVDGPIDGCLKDCLIEYEQEKRVRVFWFEQNEGLPVVLNKLLDIAFQEGYELVARMDADDISMPSRLAKQSDFLLENPEVDVVGGAIEEIDETGQLRGKKVVYPLTPELCRRFFSRRNPHAHPAVLFRKSFFDKLGGRKYRPEYRQNQDTMLWYDGMMAGTIHANISDVVLRFRITESLFKKRRNGWAFAKKQFKDRLCINRGLGYGWMADIYGFAMFCMLVSPVWVKKIAYKVFR